MNGRRDDSEDFSLDRKGRAGRDSNTDKGGEDFAAKSAPTDKPSSATVQDDALPRPDPPQILRRGQ